MTAKTFAEYVREREAQMGPEGREAVRIFDAAYQFGQVLYGARKPRGLRQADLADRSGIAQADISRIERGQIAPTTPTLINVAEALSAQIQFVLPLEADATRESTRSRGVVALNVLSA